MSKTKKRRRVTNADVERLAENLHVIFGAAPFAAAILATLFRKRIHLIAELVLIGSVIVFNFIILWLRSKTDENKELSLFYTFRTNRLLPVKIPEKQTYYVNLGIIEADESKHFRDDLKNKFKKELNFGTLRSIFSKVPKLRAIEKNSEIEKVVLEEIQDDHLIFSKIYVKPTKRADEEKLEEEFTAHLKKELGDRTTGVVVVRSQKLGEMRWVYEAVNNWAYSSSEVPILFTEKSEEDTTVSDTADGFLSIPADPKSLPWRLLQRATDRGKAWSTQAWYNRAMVWNVFYLLAFCIWVGAVWVSVQNTKYENAEAGMNEAVRTEKQYRQFTSIKEDANLSVSYWVNYNDKWFGSDEAPYIFVTTEEPHGTYYFEKDKDGLITCGFSHPNIIAEWKMGADPNNLDATVKTNYKQQPSIEIKCKMKKIDSQAPIKAIACATNDESETPDKKGDIVVGICVFTATAGNDIFGPGYEDFLRAEVVKFHKGFADRIAAHELNTLWIREKGWFIFR
jgi:hypothetical protein